MSYAWATKATENRRKADGNVGRILNTFSTPARLLEKLAETDEGTHVKIDKFTDDSFGTLRGKKFIQDVTGTLSSRKKTADELLECVVREHRRMVLLYEKLSGAVMRPETSLGEEVKKLIEKHPEACVGSGNVSETPHSEENDVVLKMELAQCVGLSLFIEESKSLLAKLQARNTQLTLALKGIRDNCRVGDGEECSRAQTFANEVVKTFGPGDL